MQADAKSKLERLRSDYEQLKGRPFTYFYCPILFRDEQTDLCRAHIINRAFRDSPRAWTIQRSDVDSFYGSNFEADFITIQYRTENWSPSEVIVDSALSKRFSPKILIDKIPVEHFVAQGVVPKDYTEVEIESSGRSVQLGLKMHPRDFIVALDKDWEIEINLDVRLPAIVSLIKAAHLSLFEMLGYQYALSAGGYFIGRQILGEFFLQNDKNKHKSEIVESALSFFDEFKHMVRPVQSLPFDAQGTITDNLLLLCEESRGAFWAFIVLVRTSCQLHAVMVPIFDQPSAASRFMGFLKTDHESIEAKLCRFNQQQDRWEIHKKAFTLTWPKSGNSTHDCAA
jgi:hypothetical protein